MDSVQIHEVGPTIIYFHSHLYLINQSLRSHVLSPQSLRLLRRPFPHVANCQDFLTLPKAKNRTTPQNS